MYDESKHKRNNHRDLEVRGKYGYMPALPITTDDLVAAFQLRFPDCLVSYKEAWVDSNANTKILTKGIMIDWS
jgi:hypothetical protein